MLELNELIPIKHLTHVHDLTLVSIFIIFFNLLIPERTQRLCIIGTENHVSVGFYEDQLRSKHLAKATLFIFSSGNTSWLVCFLTFRRWGDTLAWRPLQNLPLNRKNWICVLTAGWWLTFSLFSWAGNAAFILTLPFPAHSRWNQWSLLC